MSRQVQLLTEEMLGVADKAAEACERAQMLFAERRVNEGRSWLMKALYAWTNCIDLPRETPEARLTPPSGGVLRYKRQAGLSPKPVQPRPQFLDGLCAALKQRHDQSCNVGF